MDDKIEEIRVALSQAISVKPSNFYGTFDYTKTGNTRTHPYTIGVLSKILWSIFSSGTIEIEPRLVFVTEESTDNETFNPDVVVYDENDNAILFVDYESPNSSDNRVITKDIYQFESWRDTTKTKANYLIITTLPEGETDAWKLLYTSRNQYNHDLKGCADEVRKSPKDFWYNIYSEEFEGDLPENIHLMNISVKSVSVEKLLSTA